MKLQRDVELMIAHPMYYHKKHPVNIYIYQKKKTSLRNEWPYECDDVQMVLAERVILSVRLSAIRFIWILILIHPFKNGIILTVI